MSNDSLVQVAAMEKAAEDLIRDARAMKIRLREKCLHPFDMLDFSAGACESHMAHGVDRQIYVHCRKCDGRLNTVTVTWHKDI